MILNIKVEGDELLTAAFNKINGLSVPVCVKAMNAIVLDLQSRSQKVVPHEFGDLEGDAHTGVSTAGDIVEGKVFYTLDYAVKQHEEMNYHHGPTDTHPHSVAGRKPKYLENPFKENIPRYIDLIGKAITVISEGGVAFPGGKK